MITVQVLVAGKKGGREKGGQVGRLFVWVFITGRDAVDHRIRDRFPNPGRTICISGCSTRYRRSRVRTYRRKNRHSIRDHNRRNSHIPNRRRAASLRSNRLQYLARIRHSRIRRIHHCACRKSNPNILVMQPAQDRTAKNVPSSLNRARCRCILVQR